MGHAERVGAPDSPPRSRAVEGMRRKRIGESKAWKGEAKSAMCVLSMSVVVLREVVVVVGGRGWTSTAVAVAVGVTLLCAE